MYLLPERCDRARLQREQVDRTAIIFDYFANHNQAGATSSVTGLNWVSSCLIMMIVLYLWRKKIMFLKTSSIPKTNEMMTLFSSELMRPSRPPTARLKQPKTLVLKLLRTFCCAVMDPAVMRGALKRKDVSYGRITGLRDGRRGNIGGGGL